MFKIASSVRAPQQNLGLLQCSSASSRSSVQASSIITIPITVHVVTMLSVDFDYTRAVFFSTSDRASKEVRNTREPDLRFA